MILSADISAYPMIFGSFPQRMAIDVSFANEIIDAKDKLAHGILPEIDYGDLEFYECLSTGTYGAVYRSKWKSLDKIVAVKKLLVLEKEAHVLSVLRHKNIIQFYGAVTKAPNFCIVTEFAEKGSLYDFLNDKTNSDLTFSQIIRWSIDIASGINYLHNEAPVKIIHRDLKSKNIVIGASDLCKLCDFGTSKTVLQSASQMSVVGTVPWMSPEMIQSMPVSEHTDTWSYAVVLWELCTKELPFKSLDAFRIAWMVVEENVRLPIPSSCPQKFADLMRDCWNVEPKLRPNFRDILKTLQEIEMDENFPMHADAYFKGKLQSKIEINEQIALLKDKEKELSAKENKLSQWENRLRRREQHIELERARRCTELTPSSYDVSSWDEEDVVIWLLHSPPTDDKNFEKLTDLTSTFRQYHITGPRLFMLTENDLSNMGVDSVRYRRQLMAEISRLFIENQRLINFPSLAFSAATSTAARSRVSSFNDRKINLTLLFGVYIRQGPTLGTHKWKILMDVDDDNGYNNFDSLIDEVKYVVDDAPYVYKVTHTPFTMREWAVGFTREVTEIQCVVTFSDQVRKPSTTKLTIEFDFEKRGLLFEHPVELYVRTTPETTVAPRVNRSNSFYNNSSTTVTDAPMINLQGAWLEKAFERSVSLISSPKVESSESIGNWASVVAAPLSSSKRSSFVKTNRQLSEETRQQNNLATNSNNNNNNNNNNNVVPNASFFIEGVLSFDDEPPLLKNGELVQIKTNKNPSEENFDSK